MKKYWLVQLGVFINLLFTACSSLGENFFIRNYEHEPVNVKYIYNRYNSYDSSGFDFQPKNFVLLADTLLNKKVFNQFPYKSHLYFDTLKVNKLDSLMYEVEIPAKSTIRIAPIHYLNNINHIIINNSDTIGFIAEYPFLENKKFIDENIAKYKAKLLGDPYYILNIKLDKISIILEN